MEKLIIGSHVSFTKEKQLFGCILDALDYNANTFMFYTGAPQNTTRVEINKDRTEEAYELMEANNVDIKNIIIHAPYIINLANKKNQAFSVDFLKQELSRSEELGVTKLVLHPGSHVGEGVDKGIQNIIDALNQVVDENTKVSILLETMAGKGTELGTSFEQLKKIIDGVKYNDKILVCMDTCHINDAGYDISNFDEVLKEFDNVIGLNKLGCIHINDSKNPMSSHKDRHENIGYGTLGFDNMMKIIYHPLLENVPKILETPFVGIDEESKKKVYPPYRFEIEMIRNKKFDSELYDKIREYYM